MTSLQHRTLIAIQRHFAAHGGPPTYAEIQAAIGACSRSSVFAILHRLVEQGHISVTKGLSRSIRILRPVMDGEFFLYDRATETFEPYMPSVKRGAA